MNNTFIDRGRLENNSSSEEEWSSGENSERNETEHFNYYDSEDSYNSDNSEF